MVTRLPQYIFFPSCIKTATAFELPREEVECWKKLHRWRVEETHYWITWAILLLDHSRVLPSVQRRYFNPKYVTHNKIQMFCNFGGPPWVSGTCGSLYLREWVQNMMVVVVVVCSVKYKSGKIQFWGELMKFAPGTLQLFEKFRSAQQGERTGKWSHCYAGVRKKGVNICKFYWEKQRSRDYSENRSVMYVSDNSELPMCGNVTRSWTSKHIQQPLDHLKPVQACNLIILPL